MRIIRVTRWSNTVKLSSTEGDQTWPEISISEIPDWGPKFRNSDFVAAEDSPLQPPTVGPRTAVESLEWVSYTQRYSLIIPMSTVQLLLGSSNRLPDRYSSAGKVKDGIGTSLCCWSISFLFNIPSVSRFNRCARDTVVTLPQLPTCPPGFNSIKRLNNWRERILSEDDKLSLWCFDVLELIK